MENLFSQIPETFSKEMAEVLLTNPHFKLERILSRGQATPRGEWLCQDQDEWVVLLKGKAGVLVKDEMSVRILEPGDCLKISAKTFHRVEWTDPASPTVWLALHYSA